MDKLIGLKPTLVDRFHKWIQAHPDWIDNEDTPDANLSHPMPGDAQAQAAAQHHEEEQRREQKRLAAEDGARWRPGDNSVGHGRVRLPYYPVPSLVPRTGSGVYLQNVNSFDNRERPDPVRNPDVKSDDRSNRARQSSYSRTVWDASERDSHDGLYS